MLCGAVLGVAPFYVAFVLAPLASNASELIASLKHAPHEEARRAHIRKLAEHHEAHRVPHSAPSVARIEPQRRFASVHHAAASGLASWRAPSSFGRYASKRTKKTITVSLSALEVHPPTHLHHTQYAHLKRRALPPGPVPLLGRARRA